MFLAKIKNKNYGAQKKDFRQANTYSNFCDIKYKNKIFYTNIKTKVKRKKKSKGFVQRI